MFVSVVWYSAICSFVWKLSVLNISPVGRLSSTNWVNEELSPFTLYVAPWVPLPSDSLVACNTSYEGLSNPSPIPKVIPSLVACKISIGGLYWESVTISLVSVSYLPYELFPFCVPSKVKLSFELLVALYSPNSAPSPFCKEASLFINVSIFTYL